MWQTLKRKSKSILIPLIMISNPAAQLSSAKVAKISNRVCQRPKMSKISFCMVTQNYEVSINQKCFWGLMVMWCDVITAIVKESDEHDDAISAKVTTWRAPQANECWSSPKPTVSQRHVIMWKLCLIKWICMRQSLCQRMIFKLSVIWRCWILSSELNRFWMSILRGPKNQWTRKSYKPTRWLEFWPWHLRNPCNQ